MTSIADFFNLGPIQGFKTVYGGVNDNFFLKTSQGNYFVKISPNTGTQIEKVKESIYTSYLSNRGIPAISYMCNRSGYIIFANEKIEAMVQRKIRGTHPYQPTLDTVSQIGTVLGKMSLIHTAALPHHKGWLNQEFTVENLNILRKKFARNRRAQKILSIYDSCQDFVEHILPRLPQSIIHTDLHCENVLFAKGKLVGVIDWEDCTISASLLDFVSTAVYWCWDGERMRPRIYKSFYVSYTNQRPFTKLEQKHVVDCMKYVGVMQTIWRFVNYSQDNKKEAVWALKLYKNGLPYI